MSDGANDESHGDRLRRRPRRTGRCGRSLPIADAEQWTVPGVSREPSSLGADESRRARRCEQQHEHREGVRESVERRPHDE
jgi:hypothetical protein